MQSSLLLPDLTRDPQPGDTLILWLPVFLGLGIGAYFLLSFEPSIWAARGGVLGALSLVAATYRWRLTQSWRWGAAFLLALTLGFFLAQARTQGMGTRLLTYPGWNQTISGTIEETERAGAGWRIIISNAHINNGKTSFRLRLTLRAKNVTPHIGQVITVKASLLPPSPPIVPGLYDFQRHAYFQKLSGYGYVTKVLELTGDAHDAEQNALERYRDYIGKHVYTLLKQPDAGVTAALLNGQRGGIARGTTDTLQRSGLQHIISISGLHVGLMAGIVFYIIRLLMACSMRMALTLPIKKIAAACALVAIFVFMLIVGQDPATVRSVIMTATVLVAVMLDREAIHLRIVAIAAIILLVLAPENLLNIGFQLSFMAVTALVYFYQITQNFWQHEFWHSNILCKALRILVMTVTTTLIVTCATAPLVFVHFQQIPLLSILSNVLVTPVVSFVIMPATFLVYILSPVPFLMDLVIRFMGWGVGMMLAISDYVSSLPLSVWRIPAIPMPYVGVFTAGLLVVMIVKHRLRLIGFGLMLIGTALLVFYQPPDLYLAYGRIIAIPDRSSGMLYTEGKSDRFTQELLLKATGTKKAAPMVSTNDILVERRKGHILRIIRTVPALTESCVEGIDVILTRYYLDNDCDGVLVLDRHRLEEKGGQAVWLDRAIRVVSVYPYKTRRPWQKMSDFKGWYSRKSDAKLFDINKQGSRHDQPRR